MKNTLFIFYFTFTASCLKGQIITENFDNGMPTGWKGETSYSFDFVTENGGKIDLFKQSDGDDPLLLITEQYDLSKFTRLEIDVAGFNLSFISTSVPELHIGHFHTDSDCCFEPIHTIFVANPTLQTIVIDIASVTVNTSLVFKLEGDASHIINLDNFKLYDEIYENNIPSAVENLLLEPRLAAEPGFDMTFWLSPKREADGDLLPDLNSIDFINLKDNTLSYSFENPIPGENYSPEIDIDGGPGYYQFEVSAKNTAGNGYVRFTPTYWLGLDRPGAVSNLVATQNEDEILLEWTAPTSGANGEQFGGSYYDNSITAYNIIRSDGTEYVIPGNVTSFNDILDTEGSITYTVIPENSSGQGTDATSNILYFLKGEYLYYEDFYVNVVERPTETLDYDHKWTTQSTTSAAFWGFFTSNLAGGDEGEMAFLWGGNSANNTVRAVSPVINTIGLPAISIDFNHSIEFPANPNFSLVLETTSDGGVNWNEVASWQETTSIEGTVQKTVGNSDVGSETFQFAITVKGNAAYANFARYDNFRVYYQPSKDLIAQKAEMQQRVEPGTVVELFGVVENGSTELVSGSATCQIRERFGSEIVATFTEDLVDMGIGEVRTISFGQWESIEGEYEIEILAETPEDQKPNNNSYLHTIDVLKLVDKELVLIEEFTGTWCSYCPGAALGIDELIHEGQPIAAVAYHRNDDYETSTTQLKIDLYNVLGFPTVVFDGQVKVASGSQTVSVAPLYRPFVSEQMNTRVPVNLNLLGSEIKGNSYEAWVDITSSSNILNPNYVLRLALIENNIPEEWLGLSELEIVEKASYEVRIDLSQGFDQKFIKIDLPENMVIENSEVVAWIQSQETKEVFNATKLALTETRTSTESAEIEQVLIYPNPTEDILNISAKNSLSYNIIDINGRLLTKGTVDENGTEVDVSLFSQGLYFVELLDDKKQALSYKRFVKK